MVLDRSLSILFDRSQFVRDRLHGHGQVLFAVLAPLDRGSLGQQPDTQALTMCGDYFCLTFTASC